MNIPYKPLPFLIMAHRGMWGGNIIENTRQAAIAAKAAGADIIEVDVCRSADGVYYLFHNGHGNEMRLLDLPSDFTTYASTVIDQTPLKNSIGANSGYYTERLEDFVHWLPDNYTINLDRSWLYWDDPNFYDILRYSGKSNQFILKSPVDGEAPFHLNNNDLNLRYIPILRHQDEWERLADYNNLNIYGVELIVAGSDNVFTNDWIDEIGNQDYHILINSETLKANYPLFLGYDDNGAVLENPESHWGPMLSFGATIIQTDWPNFLYEYRSGMIS